jgi:cytoskeletal protein RodZ
MTSAGSILREERESQGRAIAEIAAELCITRRYLQAIEEDDTAGIPGLFFYKSFARQYAAVLGIDQKAILAALAAIQEPEDAQPRSEIRVPNSLVQATNRRHIPDISIGWSVVGLVLVLIGCSGIYAWWKQIPQEPAARAVIEQTSPVAIVKASGQALRTVAQPAEQNAAPSGEESGVVLKLSATEKTWLSISSDGRKIFAGTLQASESKTLTGLDRATMKVGNAGGIEVRWNGKTIGPLGTRGQVLTIKITPQDFEIVPPPQPKQEL